MTCLHNHDQILEFLQKIFLKGFQIYQNYLCALTSTYNSIIPLQQSTPSNRKKVPKRPWVTKSLLKSINRKNIFFYKYRKAPNIQNKSRYVRYRNVLTSSLRIAKKLYFSRQVYKHKNDIKSTWKVINEALH